MKNNIILIGFFSEVYESLKDDKYDVIGYVDFDKNTHYEEIHWLGTDENINEIKIRYPNVEIIISPDLPYLRKKISKLYINSNYNIYSFIHSKSYVSKSAKIDAGIFVQRNVFISSNCIFGKLVKVNVGAQIFHNCQIGNYTTIAPSAVILGNVTIGSECYIGANSTILPNITIGNNVVIGAGSVVTKNIQSSKIVKGIPAK